MMNRRGFTALLMGALASGRVARAAQSFGRTVFYASVGRELTLYDVDVEEASLARRSSVILPANVQYAWPHPSRRYFYVVSSNGAPGGGEAARGDTHVASAFRIDPASGALAPHGPEARLPSRPIHTSVDRTGRFLLIAYNDPSGATVHRLNGDGTIGAPVAQPDALDTGIYAHQILATPSNATVIVVARGNNAASGRPEDPGSLRVFGFGNGLLTPLQTVTAGNNGLGFGPRHLDFHPGKPWVYVSIERQNQLHVYALRPDGRLSDEPLFVKTTLMAPRDPALPQGAGTIHIHPNGRFAYVPNRAAGTVRLDGREVFAGGENNIAVFEIDQGTGEPILVQHIDGHGIQLRTFGIDPSGRLLVAASIQSLFVRRAGRIEKLPAGLSVYRIGADGRLSFVRKYDVDTSAGMQFWSGMVTLA